MRKTLKTIAALMLVACTVFAGCQSFDDLVPEEYGGWEDNYIYRGNVRSKTTGEAWEYLVTEVEDDGVTYTVQSCQDYAISGDDIYMCLNLTSEQQGLLYTNGIVKYNVQSKTQEVLCVYEALPTQSEGAGTQISYNPYSIEGISSEGLLLYGQKESATYAEEGTREEYTNQTVYYLLNFEGNVVEDAVFNYSYFAKVNDTYYSNTDYKDDKWNFYYVTLDMQEPKLVCQKPVGEYDYQTTFVEKNGAVGFLISTLPKPQEDKANTQLFKLEFYNIKTDTLTTLYEGTRFVKWIEIPQNEYFVSYDYETVSYHYREGIFKPKQEASVEMKTNCVVHQIIYSEQGAKCETFQSFGQRKDITDIRAVVADGKLLAKLVWYEDARGCAFGGMQSGNYEINLVTGKQKDMDSDDFKVAEDEYFGYYARQTGKTCGDYIYYLQKEELSTVGSKQSYAYLLQRYNTKSEKTEVMQLWHAEYAREGEKVCEEMWRRTGGDIEEFIVRGY